MKRLISTKGLHDGHFDAPWICTAIHERVDNKLTHCYKQDYGEDIVIAPTLSYELVVITWNSLYPALLRRLVTTFLEMVE